MTDRFALTIRADSESAIGDTALLPAHVVSAGGPARIAWDDFFSGTIQNQYTRAAYKNAVRRFFGWLPSNVPLERITPGMVGRYFGEQSQYSIPTRKLHLAALRAFFDLLVERHIILLNPAASVRGPRHQVIEGKTPEITVEQARTLIARIRVTTTNTAGEPIPAIVGVRDRAVIGMMFYTAARAGAIAKLRMKHLRYDGVQYSLRFDEKGGKSREIPVRSDLHRWILDYIELAHVDCDDANAPLFRTSVRRTRTLTRTAMSNIDICRMVKRRLADAGLPGTISPHSFRVAAITDLLTHGEALDEGQS